MIAASVPEEERYALRARLRKVVLSQRERQCGVVSCHMQGPSLGCSGRSGAWRVRWEGVQTCGHIWTCPVCSAKLREERLARVTRALEVSGGRWQMVTLTIRHRPGDDLKRLLAGMMAAWRRARQGGETQRIWKARVTASVRAIEVTHGANGWHPHLHVLLRSSEWHDDEREALFKRWCAALQQHLGPAHVPDERHGVFWSRALDVGASGGAARAAYIAKLGLEVASSDKLSPRGSQSAWGVARAAAAGDARAVQLWRDYYAATKGRRMLELDDRAARFAATPRDIELGEPPEEQFRRVMLDSLELKAFREYEREVDPRVLAIVLGDVAKADDPVDTVRRWVDLVTTVLHRRFRGRGPPRYNAPCPTFPVTSRSVRMSALA